MLRIYLTSVLIYMIIIYALAYIGQDKINENGWTDGIKKKGKPLVGLFCLAAVPILRIFFVLVIILMIGMTKEKFEKEFQNVSN